MTLHYLRHYLLGLLLTVTASAQLSATLKLTKKQYLAGEAVLAVVTVTNFAGQPLTFASDGRMQWLDFIVKNNRGDLVPSISKTMFGRMTIAAGQTMAREVDLAQNFQLSESGSYIVSAVIHTPGGSAEGTSTNRVSFNQSPGAPYWTQKVGIPGRPGHTRDFRIINFSGDEKNQIYAQVLDNRTGHNVRTFLLGDVLLLRKPLVTVDRDQKMHVMFLATPSLWVHCRIDTDGKLVDRKLHKRGAQGDPQLLTASDGTVHVYNSVPFDEKADADAKAKIRKASDRPKITY